MEPIATNSMFGNRLDVAPVWGTSSYGGGGGTVGSGGVYGAGANYIGEKLSLGPRRGGGVEGKSERRQERKQGDGRSDADDALIFADQIAIANSNQNGNANDSDSVRYVNRPRGEGVPGGGRAEGGLVSAAAERGGVPAAIVTSSVSVLDMGVLPSPSK